MVTPREHVERPRSARTAAGVRFAAAEEIFDNRPAEHFDSVRPRTAASRGAVQERPKQDKVFAFTVEGHMNNWQTTSAHDIAAADTAPQAFPTPNFVRKAAEARSRPPVAVPPLNLAAISRSTAKPHDALSARPAVSSSARSSSFTPRDSERSRPRPRDQHANGQDFLDSYRQVHMRICSCYCAFFLCTCYCAFFLCTCYCAFLLCSCYCAFFLCSCYCAFFLCSCYCAFFLCTCYCAFFLRAGRDA